MNYWLVKSEPSAYSIQDLKRDGKTDWSGVRNYQARNFMRDQMKIGDKVLYYHSNTEVTGVVGVAEVCSEPYPDPTAFDPESHYFDPKSSPDKPTWILVDIKFVEEFPRTVTLAEIKADSELSKMMVAQKGMRLSVQPVSKEHFELILKRAGKES